jgi:hypothetical protein
LLPRNKKNTVGHQSNQIDKIRAVMVTNHLNEPIRYQIGREHQEVGLSSEKSLAKGIADVTEDLDSRVVFRRLD